MYEFPMVPRDGLRIPIRLSLGTASSRRRHAGERAPRLPPTPTCTSPNGGGGDMVTRACGEDPWRSSPPAGSVCSTPSSGRGQQGPLHSAPLEHVTSLALMMAEHWAQRADAAVLRVAACCTTSARSASLTPSSASRAGLRRPEYEIVKTTQLWGPRSSRASRRSRHPNAVNAHQSTGMAAASLRARAGWRIRS